MYSINFENNFITDMEVFRGTSAHIINLIGNPINEHDVNNSRIIKGLISKNKSVVLTEYSKMRNLEFKYPEFKTKLVELYDVNKDKEISIYEMEKIKELYIDKRFENAEYLVNINDIVIDTDTNKKEQLELINEINKLRKEAQISINCININLEDIERSNEIYEIDIIEICPIIALLQDENSMLYVDEFSYINYDEFSLAKVESGKIIINREKIGQAYYYGGICNDTNLDIVLNIQWKVVPPSKKIEEIFEDIKKDEWYYEAIEFVYDNGIIIGKTDTLFKPNDILTRGQIVTMLWRMEKMPIVESGKNFPDVKIGDYYYEAIKWASSKKVVNGYSTGKFGPNDNITREQLAVMLHNYAIYKKKDISKTMNISNFKDAKKVSDYAVKAVSWAIANKVMNGKQNRTIIDPRGNATRAQTAVMIQNYYKIK